MLVKNTVWHKIIRVMKHALFTAIFVPAVVLAANPPPVALENPLVVKSITDLLTAILNIVMVLMIPIVVFYIIYSGFKYVAARGNASQVEEASQSLLYAVVGGVLILGALAIAEIIRNVVAAFQTTP